ncbi:MAG: formylglycine-generating enzyme family protein [Treponema sp.]|nr:formylglycine-generating enzyme family protein [Treponema sp.]
MHKKTEIKISSLTACIIFSAVFCMGAFGQQAADEADPAVVNEMVYLNGGTFTMGSPASERGRSTNEGPQHQVTLSPFSIEKYPVTQAEYEQTTGSNPSSFKGENLPVEQVSWMDALLYCNKRSVAEGLTPVYTINGNNVSWDHDADGYRLPTEAEWEYACRAGTQTPFYSGTSVNDAGWHSGNSGGKTHPVGQKLPNDWGLYDMHGNVLEWCWDRLGSYSTDPQTDPQGAATGTDRVYRGGSWYFEPLQTRSAFRFGNQPGLRIFFVGFRVVRSA